MKAKKLRIVFMGTPAFAVPSLQALLCDGYTIAGVVTAPDRPAGRGLKKRESPVKQYAHNIGLEILQPENLGEEKFIHRLHSLGADLYAVVAFRILPEAVWSYPPLGTINLHASLLPQYRGAAPIQRAIMNGEKETGLTTFFIRKDVDTGHIILQQKVNIGDHETAGELHDRLMHLGARLLLETVQAVEKGKCSAISQESLIKDTLLKTAPKITKEDCRIRWNRPLAEVYNQIRGLSPSPGAFTEFCDPEGNRHSAKIFISRPYTAPAGSSPVSPGSIDTDGKSFLSITAAGGFIHLLSLQLSGRKRMETEEILRGFRITKEWKAI